MAKKVYTNPMIFLARGADIGSSHEGGAGEEDESTFMDYFNDYNGALPDGFKIGDKSTWPAGFDPDDPDTWDLVFLDW